jgi:hypothetical protein
MTNWRTRVLAIVATGCFATAPFAGSQLWAQHPPPPVVLPVPQVTPQFNDPGPQLTLPQPGNPVQQLSPSLGTSAPVYSAPQVYVVPEESPKITVRRHRHHVARHRHAATGQVDKPRSAEPPRARAR